MPRRLPTSTLFPYTTLFRSKKSDKSSPSPSVATARPNAISKAAMSSILSGERLRSGAMRSEEHTSELQSRGHLVCRLLLEKKRNQVLHAVTHACLQNDVCSA